ncbi:sensor histidine kinase [Thermodesulfobacteriota bacterium]
MHRKRIKTELLVHDMKNPLAVIEAGIHLLINKDGENGSLTEKQLKVLHRILRNTKVAMGLVNDILEVGRSTVGVIDKDKCRFYDFISYPLVEIFDLTDHNTAERTRECHSLPALKAVLSDKDILLNMDECLWSQEVYLDLGKIRQILRNLISNALKYRKKIIEIEIGRDKDFLSLSVRDDGEGIPKSYHKKVFECYFQLKDDKDSCVRGHGLGLAGVLILVEDMGGEMRLESDEGKGAKLSVRIPLDRQ